MRGQCWAVCCWFWVGALVPSYALPVHSPQALWSFMGLHPRAEEQAPFVMTDNVAGYFEGVSFSPEKGAGYRYREQRLMQSCSARVDGEAIRYRDPATQITVLPFSVEYHTADRSESLMLHSGRSVISCRVRSQTAQTLSLSVNDLFDGAWQTYANDELALYRANVLNEGVPRFMAVVPVSSVPLVNESSATQLTWKSLVPAQEFSLHLVFAHSAEAAVAESKRLLHENVYTVESEKHFQRLSRHYVWTSDELYNRALLWARASAFSFVMNEFGRGIWAGLPWFRDNWGRDTFIALPGTLLINGHFDVAKAVLDNFWQWQLTHDKQSPLYGRVPNRVAANTETIYNTVDGTPWLIRELHEYVLYSGDEAYARAQLARIDAYIDGVQAFWLDKNGLLTHDDADTWMDARIEGQQAWSPRGNRAVEIQALWITTLQIAAQWHMRAGNTTVAKHYQTMATQAQESFVKLFWRNGQLADRLRADDSADFTLRPNQILALTVPFSPLLSPSEHAQLLNNVVPQLVLPYGVLSLDPRHAAFHPYHENPSFHHKDAAYHNGTIWGWNAGFVVSALNQVNRADLSWQLTRSLSTQILSQGTRGTMSELLDALPNQQGQIKPSGTFAQAWSVAEFARNSVQDFVGYTPDAVNNRVRLAPRVPDAWHHLSASLPFGHQGKITLRLARVAKKQQWTIHSDHDSPLTVEWVMQRSKGEQLRATFVLEREATLAWENGKLRLNGQAIAVTPIATPWSGIADQIRLRDPSSLQHHAFPVLKENDQLRKRILAGESVF